MDGRSRRATSLIDLLVSMAIVAVLFGGIYLVYFSIVTAVGNISVRTAATTAVNNELEMIRNLSYSNVGTVGGVPSGVIPQSQVASVGNYVFTLVTTVRNIDDPFDGTLGGTPNDTAPADYKLVAIVASCALCNNFGSVQITTTVAPKDLESATQNGSLFLYALDANGSPVSDAVMTVTNASVTPSINLTDTTNASGVLELVGVPTSTQGYNISVAKSGYSSDRTYPLGGVGNPNPVTPNATVAAQTVTDVSFSIDRTSSLTVSVSSDRCVAIGSETFSIAGAKLIGTSPNVLKFSTSSALGASGSVTMANMEWDTYTLSLSDASRNLEGTIPLNPITVNPSSTANFRFVMSPLANPSLLVTVVDAATGAAIPGASVTLSKSGFSKTFTAGHSFLTQTDWSGGGQYSSQSGGLDANSVPGKVTLLANASGTYATSTNDWLISNTFDLGGSSSTFYNMTWDPTSQAGSGTLLFQVAANNDNATWNFVGPDGTSATYFTTSSTTIPASLAGNRYFRYKAYLNTQNPTFTPELDDISMEFSADCVPPAQVLFTSLASGSYTVSVTAANYINGSGTVSVGAGATSTIISLNHA